MKGNWNYDPRAVVPPEHMRDSTDVLRPSGKEAMVSPFPFGLGVYAFPEGVGGKPVALPLYYVSKTVERDRSPSVNPDNPDGVRAGWYVVAKPSQRFEVRVSRVSSKCTGYKQCLDGIFQTNLIVDGEYTKEWYLFGMYAGGKMFLDREFAFQGYIEKEVEREGSFTLEQDMRHFCFHKAVSKDLDGEDCDKVGTIELEVKIGKKVRRSTRNRTERYRRKGKSEISAKSIAKHGKSLGVYGLSRTVSQTVSLCAHGMADRCTMPEASVVIFVREASWMRSRRLLDDNSNPCSYAKYLRLLKHDRSVGKQEQAVASNAASSSEVKSKMEVEVIELEEKPATSRAGVIDLT